ncbi:MAG: retropepsin-like domain-containing protein [Ruminococcus flavefaciens]|nr:retropepsin-like domain-containing protein [Roseburia sp.]MCM1231429.1 retropepsin-like domain-containing protein [Ruminococcus flavefaciens]
MYSTNIEDDRCLVDCLMVSNDVSIEKFVIDTGAKFTCCSYQAIDSRLKEEQVSDSEIKLIGGIVKGEYLKFYKFQLTQFTIGNIDMGMQDIWITFDKRITDIILGMDILKQIVMIMNPYNQTICFCKDVDDYNNFELEAV